MHKHGLVDEFIVPKFTRGDTTTLYEILAFVEGRTRHRPTLLAIKKVRDKIQKAETEANEP